MTKARDKIDGLESDLDSALDVLWRHGDREAHDWMWLNYPAQARRLAFGCSTGSLRLGKRLVKAAEEMIAIAKGEADPSTYRMHVPRKPMTPEDRHTDMLRRFPRTMACLAKR
jgi:hypothetical protein